MRKHTNRVSPRFLGGIALCLAAGASLSPVPGFLSPPAQAQTLRPVPSQDVLARLIWSTMVALENANTTDDYTVFWKLGSPEFQATSTPAGLSQSFADLRAQNIDLSRSLFSSPSLYIPPMIDTRGLLRLRGAFESRPTSLRFDLYFKDVDGMWKIHAVSVAELPFDAPR